MLKNVGPRGNKHLYVCRMNAPTFGAYSEESVVGFARAYMQMMRLQAEYRFPFPDNHKALQETEIIAKVSGEFLGVVVVR